MSNNNQNKKNNNTGNGNAKNRNNNNTSTTKKKGKRSEAAMARRAAKWATKKAEKKAQTIAKQEAKKEEKEKQQKTVLEVFPSILGIVGAQGFMPNIKKSTLVSKGLSQALKNTPLFQNANRSTIYPNGMTLLNKYLEENNWEKAMEVLKLGVSKQVLNHPNSAGEPPLLYVFQNRQLPLFKKLIEMGADVNIKVTNGKMTAPLIHVFVSSYLVPQSFKEECIKAILKKGVKLNEVDSEGFTALDRAITLEDNTIAKLFIDNDADVEKPNKRGFTAVLTAITRGNMDMLKYMFEKGKVHINLETGPNKLTPLKIATLNGSLFIFDEVLKQKPNVNQQDLKGNTALHYAIMTKNYEKMVALKKAGASVSIKNKEEISPMDLVKATFKDANQLTYQAKKALEEMEAE
jgi:ankyrin repeat protein